MCMPLPVLCTACPEVWGREGTIEKAMAKDIDEEVSRRGRPSDCPLSDEEWAEVCDSGSDRERAQLCPDDCGWDKQ